MIGKVEFGFQVHHWLVEWSRQKQRGLPSVPLLSLSISVLAHVAQSPTHQRSCSCWVVDQMVTLDSHHGLPKVHLWPWREDACSPCGIPLGTFAVRLQKLCLHLLPVLQLSHHHLCPSPLSPHWSPALSLWAPPLVSSLCCSQLWFWADTEPQPWVATMNHRAAQW